LVIEEEDKNIYVHQSWLGMWLRCQESSRRYILEGSSDDSDATIVGTALHTAVESNLAGLNTHEAMDAAASQLTELMANPDLRWIKTQNPDLLHAYLSNCFFMWERDVKPRLGHVTAIEVEHAVPIAEVDGWTIWIRGTLDLVTTNGPDDEIEIWDWKTAARDYTEWEYQRYAIQPTCYSYLAAHLFGTPEGAPIDFTYAVMPKIGTIGKHKAQVFTVQRGQGHWSWLREQVLVAVRQYLDGGLEGPWQYNDQGWWCSPKWCTAYSDCKGAHLSLGDSNVREHSTHPLGDVRPQGRGAEQLRVVGRVPRIGAVRADRGHDD
jgi:hypothetical protein